LASAKCAPREPNRNSAPSSADGDSEPASKAAKRSRQNSRHGGRLAALRLRQSCATSESAVTRGDV
jgi:hypothetical protein